MAASVWTASAPTAANQVSADVTNIRNNFLDLERILETLTNGTFGTTDTDSYRIKPTPGFTQRPQFSWKDADEIYIGAGGCWHLSGATEKLIYTSDTLTFAFGSGGTNAGSSNLGNDDWFYLYLDDSAIITADSSVLAATGLIALTTEPTWTVGKWGWYNGNDRFIAAFRTGGSANILEFYHEGDLIQWADSISIIGNTDLNHAAWTDEQMILPVGSRRAVVHFYSAYVDGTSTMYWRTNGQTGATGKICGYCSAGSTREVVKTVVHADATGVIEVKKSADNADTLAINQDGYYFGTAT